MAKCLRPTVQMAEHELRDAIGSTVEFELLGKSDKSQNVSEDYVGFLEVS